MTTLLSLKIIVPLALLAVAMTVCLEQCDRNLHAVKRGTVEVLQAKPSTSLNAEIK